MHLVEQLNYIASAAGSSKEATGISSLYEVRQASWTAGELMCNRPSSPEEKLRILITNTCLASWTGSELYARDIALQLFKRGHKPVLYSPRLGELAERLTACGIPVLSSLKTLEGIPDLIHGQHHLETMTALAQFPGVPAIYFCHGRGPWEEVPPSHPRILRYVAVSSPVKDHLISYGIEAGRIARILNFVDLERFQPREPLPRAPKRALLFNNQANGANSGRTVRKACDCYGISLDIVGQLNGNPTHLPERLLRNYDLIFACGRGALEGLAVGAAVICYDKDGLGPMVTQSNLEWLRRENFAILDQPVTVKTIFGEMNRYDDRDAAAVSRMVRSSAGADDAVERILDEYKRVLTESREAGPCDQKKESLSYATYFAWISIERDAELRAIKSDLTRKIKERLLAMGVGGVVASACRQTFRWLRRYVKKLRSGRRVLARAEFLFDFDKDILTEASLKGFQKGAAFVKKYPGAKIRIEGYTDSSGSDAYNLKLSERRATAVMNYLIKEASVDRSKITAVGHGKANPVADNGTAAGRAKNRRVEISILSDKEGRS